MANNMEKVEAQQAIDQLAREIHGIYGQHAAEAGLKTPKWEEIPESAKGISRDISRLVLSKMQEAYTEGSKAHPLPEAKVVHPVKPWDPEDLLKFVDGLKPKIDDLIERVADEKRMRPSPMGKGLDAAISRLVEKITLDVMAENPEMLVKLRQIVEGELTQFLSDDDDKKEA